MPKLADCLKVKLDRKTQAAALVAAEWLDQNPCDHGPDIYCEFCNQQRRHGRERTQEKA